MDIVKRINELRKARNWSVNNLALEAELTQSTLSSMLQRNTPPRLDTLMAICNAFGITLAQFFVNDENSELLNNQEKELIKLFRTLSPEQKNAILTIIKK